MFYATLKGFYYRLALSTSFNETNLMKVLDQLCLVHAKALWIARLIKDNNFSELIDYILTTTKPRNADSTDSTDIDDDAFTTSNSFNPNIRNVPITLGFCELREFKFLPKLRLELGWRKGGLAMQKKC